MFSLLNLSIGLSIFNSFLIIQISFFLSNPIRQQLRRNYQCKVEIEILNHLLKISMLINKIIDNYYYKYSKMFQDN